ncbi:methylamine utilization protein MauJ [Priestia aryabhattai]
MFTDHSKLKIIFNSKHKKGIQKMDPFFSDIRIRNFNEGLIINITANAPTSKLANNAALVFVGQMLDCLIIAIGEGLPIFLSFDGKSITRTARERHIKRIVTEEELKWAFKESRTLSTNEPVFLKAYSWYRKGLYTEDPFDKFLAFYNTIELISSKYHPKNEASTKGSKSQMWECFKEIWGEYTEWPVYIQGNKSWIDYNYETRKDIAHGLAIVNVEEIDRVTSMIDTIQNVAFIFLRDWKRIKLN